MTKKFRRRPKDKKTGLPKVYLSGAKNKAAKAAEIKKTAAAYKRGEKIDLKAISKFRVSQDGTKKKEKAQKVNLPKLRPLKKRQRIVFTLSAI